RRQELLIDTPGLKVVEDFGHHPTALAATLQSIRARFPGHVVHAAFEPRSNTSRTKVMQAGFMRALALADEVYLGAIARADKIKPEDRFDVEALLQFLDSQGVHGYTAPTNAALLEQILLQTQAGSTKRQLVVFFTNGSFDGIIQKFVAAQTA
ncbi:MAG: cyanophycin synthetase, partial [Candidatus Didemnitutus sp.]|nr:cyanophycin synthetase [Candidatus Didemnitutus sp.]